MVQIVGRMCSFAKTESQSVMCCAWEQPEQHLLQSLASKLDEVGQNLPDLLKTMILAQFGLVLNSLLGCSLPVQSDPKSSYKGMECDDFVRKGAENLKVGSQKLRDLT